MMGEPGQAHDVIPGVQHEQHRRVARQLLPGLAQPGEQAADLGGGDLGGIVLGPRAHHVQRAGPRGAAAAEGCGDLVGPAADGLTHPVAAARTVAVQALG